MKALKHAIWTIVWAILLMAAVWVAVPTDSTTNPTSSSSETTKQAVDTTDSENSLGWVNQALEEYFFNRLSENPSQNILAIAISIILTALLSYLMWDEVQTRKKAFKEFSDPDSARNVWDTHTMPAKKMFKLFILIAWIPFFFAPFWSMNMVHLAEVKAADIMQTDKKMRVRVDLPSTNGIRYQRAIKGVGEVGQIILANHECLPKVKVASGKIGYQAYIREDRYSKGWVDVASLNNLPSGALRVRFVGKQEHGLISLIFVWIPSKINGKCPS